MPRFLLVVASLVLAATPGLAQENAAHGRYGVPTTTTIWAGVYTDRQAAQGQAIYASACAECHGEQLEGVLDEGFPGLADPSFMVEWDGQTMADLVRHIHTAPNDQPGDMDPVTAVELAAFILEQNGVPSGKTPLSTDAKQQAKILFTEAKPK